VPFIHTRNFTCRCAFFIITALSRVIRIYDGYLNLLLVFFWVSKRVDLRLQNLKQISLDFFVDYKVTLVPRMIEIIRLRVNVHFLVGHVNVRHVSDVNPKQFLSFGPVSLAGLVRLWFFWFCFLVSFFLLKSWIVLSENQSDMIKLVLHVSIKSVVNLL